jgi:hypothetical protein
MKKNVYFTAPNHNTQELGVAIKNAVDQRDEWLNINKNSIAKIDNEEIKFVTWNNINQHVMVTIQLTYYPK